MSEATPHTHVNETSIYNIGFNHKLATLKTSQQVKKL